MKTKKEPGNSGSHTDKKKVDLKTCPVDKLVHLIKSKKCSISEVPFRRMAQVQAFKKKAKKVPDLATEKVPALKAMVENKERQLTEIPLQKRLQIQIKLDQEEALRKYYEENPD